jgi:hypothetical protein
VIRLGSLAGYPFEGPRLLGGWTVPPLAAVYAIAYKPDPEEEHFAIIYVGHSDDLTTERFPFHHPRAACWIRRAGSKWRVYIATFEVPGGTRPHREQIARELTAVYRPGCNDQQFDHAWKDEWFLNNSSERAAGQGSPDVGAAGAGAAGISEEPAPADPD